MTDAAGTPTRPTLAEVRAWIDVPASSLTDPQLQDVLDGETEAQNTLCTVDPYRSGLRLALLRRCARAVAAMGLPLGVIAGGDFGNANLPRFDAEIERYERPWRKVVLA